MEEKTQEHGSIKVLVDFMQERQWSVSYLRSVAALVHDNERDALAYGGVAILGKGVKGPFSDNLEIKA